MPEITGDDEPQKTIEEVLTSKTKPFIAGHTDIGKLLSSTREDGAYTMAMYDCEMAIMKLVKQYGNQRELEGRIDALTEFAPPVEERRRADSFHGSIYVVKVGQIDSRITTLINKKEKE